MARQEEELRDKTITKYKWKSTEFLRVQAFDHGTPILSTDEVITIIIVDVNDHPPTFPHTIENATVLENTKDVIVTSVKAEDIDKDSIIEYKIKKDESGSFKINLKDGTITIIKELDRENTTNAIISLVIEAVDASGTNASDQCYDSIFTQNNSTTTTVNIKILDQNDNPPIFKSSFISIGVRRTITTGKTEAFIYDLKESVKPDPDSEQYSVHQFSVNGKLTYSSGDQLGQKIQELLNTNKIKACTGSNDKTPICVTGNGTVNTNIQLEENMKGYINIPLIVRDAAGNSTTEMRIYIISDYQTGSILINGNKEYVHRIKADLMRILTQLTKQNFTADGIRPFNTGTFQSTYLDFHVADPKTGTILSAKDAIQLFDKYSSQLGVTLKQYSILAAKTYTETQSQDDEGGIKTTYIMIAVIALLGATNLLIGFCFCSSATRYQHKLKAATTKSTVDQDKDGKETHPGTNLYARNQNPLLNKEVDFTNIDYDRFADDASVASYDSNQFTKKEPIRGDEEKGATMDMYDDERDVQQGDNESLAMVLEQYKKEKAASRESLVPRDMHNGHLHTDEFTHSFDNDGLELSLETTEV
ncbi:protocadherin Fat 4-like [Mytilus trossulus]|uniref:protocadherin Fat 4-like n=1 Tax=Mytilus trossulus TaxID=6551 RepID=UPI003007EB26